jgi:hypothetical protein
MKKTLKKNEGKKCRKKKRLQRSEGSSKGAAAMYCLHIYMYCLHIIYIQQQQACCIYIICMFSRKRAQLKLKTNRYIFYLLAVKRRSLPVLRLRAYLFFFFTTCCRQVERLATK